MLFNWRLMSEPIRRRRWASSASFLVLNEQDSSLLFFSSFFSYPSTSLSVSLSLSFLFFSYYIGKEYFYFSSSLLLFPLLLSYRIPTIIFSCFVTLQDKFRKKMSKRRVRFFHREKRETKAIARKSVLNLIEPSFRKKKRKKWERKRKIEKERDRSWLLLRVRLFRISSGLVLYCHAWLEEGNHVRSS